MRKKAFIPLFFVFIALLTLVSFRLKNKVDIALKNQLTTVVNKSFKGAYEISTGKLQTNFFKGSATLNEITLLSKKETQTPILKANIAAIQLTGLSWNKYLKGKEISFEKIALIKPTISFQKAKNDTSGNKDLSALLTTFLLKFTGGIKVQNLAIEHGKATYISGTLKHTSINTAENINFSLKGISIIKAKNPYIHSEKVDFSLGNISIREGNKQILAIEQVSGNSKDSSYTAKNIILNDLSLKNYTVSGNIQTLTIKDFRIPPTLLKDELTIEKILLNNGKIAIEQKDPVQVASKPILPFFSIDQIAINNLAVSAKTAPNERDFSFSGLLSLSIDSIKKTNNQNKVQTGAINFLLSKFEMKGANNEQLTASSISNINKRFHAKDIKYEQEEVLGNRAGVDLSILSCTLEGLNQHALKKSDLNAQTLELEKPMVKIRFSNSNTTDKKTTLNSLIAEFGKNYFNEVAIAKVKVKNGGLKLNYHSGKEYINQVFENIQLATPDFKIGQAIKNTPLLANALDLSIDKYKIASSAGNFELKAENLKASGQRAEITGEKIEVKQVRAHGRDQPYFWSKKVKTFESKGINFEQLLNNNALIGKSLHINNMDLSIYFDETKCEANKPNSSLRDILMLIPFPIDLKNLEIAKSSLEFTDFIGKHYKAASLSLKNLKFNISDFSNNALKPHRISLINGMSNIKGTALSFSMKIPFMAPALQIEYAGKLGAVEATSFNDWMAFADIGVKKGYLDGLTFAVSIKEGKASGIMSMLYHDLRLAIFSSKTGKKKKVISFLSRLFIHKNNTIGSKKLAEAVQINTALTPGCSFFYSLWQPLKEGMVETIRNEMYLPEM